MNQRYFQHLCSINPAQIRLFTSNTKHTRKEKKRIHDYRGPSGIFILIHPHRRRRDNNNNNNNKILCLKAPHLERWMKMVFATLVPRLQRLMVVVVLSWQCQQVPKHLASKSGNSTDDFNNNEKEYQDSRLCENSTSNQKCCLEQQINRYFFRRTTVSTIILLYWWK
jgi:hypothetical protein